MNHRHKRKFMDEALVIWIKTFDTLIPTKPPTNVLQLTDGNYLLEVMALIANKSPHPDRIQNCSDANSRLTNLDILHRQIHSFYSDTLQQIVTLTPPDLINLSQDPELSSCGSDMLRVLLLLLGCATQCSRKEEFMQTMHSLQDSCQEAMMNYFKELSEHTMSAIDASLNLDDSTRSMYRHICRLVDERDHYVQRCIDLVLRPSSNSNSSGPAVNFSERDQMNQKMQSLIAELEEKSTQMSRLREEIDNRNSEIRKLKSQNSLLDRSVKTGAELKEKVDQATEKARQAEKFEGEVYRLRQQLSEMEFYRSRVQELRDDNSGLIEEKQRLEDLLNNSRRKEEDVIERLVECQLRLDELQGERETDRRRIGELLESNTTLEKNLRQWQASVGGGGETGGGGQQRGGGVDKERERERVKRTDLEREVEGLKTRLMEAQKQGEQKEDKWKFLETQKEKLEIRRELTKVREHAENDRLRTGELEARVTSLQRERDHLESEASMQRAGHEEHIKDLEGKIKDLTKQVMLLRRKGAKLVNAQFREMEATELELMYQSVQELTTQMSQLKVNNKILRQACDKLKEDVDKIITIEEENERLARENRELRRQLSSKNTSGEQSDELRRKNLQLEIENKKLRRIIDSLRMTLVQIDPYNRLKYHYITSI